MHRQRREMALFLPLLLLSICSVSAAGPPPVGDEPLSVLNQQLAEMKMQLEQLQTQNEARQVAFTASLLTSGEGYTGPFNTHTNLIFRNVIVNIGNAYNRLTGVFTAPVKGAYHFEFYIWGRGEPSRISGAVLMKNEQQICTAYENKASHNGKSANGATLALEVGDVVFLRHLVNSRIFDNHYNHNTFSGHLLFTM